MPSHSTKVHQIHYFSRSSATNDLGDLLAVSTEDGRVLFYSTRSYETSTEDSGGSQVPTCRILGQLGGKESGITGRIKDFEILDLEDHCSEPQAFSKIIVTACSAGSVSIWAFKGGRLRLETDPTDIPSSRDGQVEDPDKTPGGDISGPTVPQVATLVSTYETGNRITCLKAFVLLESPESSLSNGHGKAEDDKEAEAEFDGFGSSSERD